MGEWDDEPELQRSSAGAEAARFYEETRGLLLRLFTRKLGIPEAEAEQLVYDTFFAFQGVDRPPPDTRAWLIGAACSRAAAYLQAPPERVASEFAETLRYRQALELLSPRAREALRLYYEKKTYAEIAAELGIATFAAKRIVKTAAAKVRKWMREG